MKTVLQSLRLEQWIKNSFVLMPLVFSRHLNDTGFIIKAFVFTFAFCLASSAVYLLNDVIDKEQDKHHPDKKERPVAKGTLKVRNALFLSLLLAASSLGICSFFPIAASAALALYLVNNILYSIFLKKIVVLDVILIALGFVLRVIGGAEAIGVEASVWLIMCTFLISLFLGFCKRKQELLVLQNNSAEHRYVLEHYNIGFLDHMIAVVSACTILSYALYTVADDTIGKFGTEKLYFSVPFVVYGVFRYMYQINVLKTHKSTSQIILNDRSFMINMVLWLGVLVILIYY